MNWNLIIGVFVALSGLFCVVTVGLLHWLHDDGAAAAAREMYDATGLRAVVLLPFVVWLVVLMVFAIPSPADPNIIESDPE